MPLPLFSPLAPGRAPLSARSADASPLFDAQGRGISYLRLSLTDRCNFRCTYCSPAHWSGKEDTCSADELVRLVRVFASMGVWRVRLTGGEPLLRPDIVDIARRIKETEGIRELCLTTNGHHLARLAPALSPHIDRINVSFDSPDPALFESLTGRGRIAPVLEGLKAARLFASRAMNVVVMKDVNDSPESLRSLVQLAWEMGMTPRFIELMPFAGGGEHVPTRLVKSRLEEAGIRLGGDAARSGAGPSRYSPARAVFGEGEIGFIGAMSENFCESCNRVRVTSKGELRSCLGGRDQVPLIGLLRGGASDEELSRAVRAALGAKWAGHRFEEGGRGLLPMMDAGG